jgi:UDP-GlcNAc:undecaprenyl-phosphate GlcNAc-1-phosphate transferase
MGVYARGPETTQLAVLAPLAVLSLPLFDLALVVGLRLREGHPPWVGDRRHLSHRLVRRGLRPPVAVATLWLFAGLGALVGCLLPNADLSRAVALLLLLGGALVALALAAGKRGLS